MLRCADQIRLTALERAELTRLTGIQAEPRTVAQYNALIERAQHSLHTLADATPVELNADGVDESGHAECRLLAAVLDGARIAE